MPPQSFPQMPRSSRPWQCASSGMRRCPSCISTPTAFLPCTAISPFSMSRRSAFSDSSVLRGRLAWHAAPQRSWELQRWVQRLGLTTLLSEQLRRSAYHHTHQHTAPLTHRSKHSTNYGPNPKALGAHCRVEKWASHAEDFWASSVRRRPQCS